MAVEVKTSNTFEGGVPRQLFQTNIKMLGGLGCPYSVTPDGRFLINTRVEANNSAPMTIVLNWTADLKK
jgi:hydrogenase maturation factor